MIDVEISRTKVRPASDHVIVAMPPGATAGQRCQTLHTDPTMTAAQKAPYCCCNRGCPSPRQPTSSPKDPAMSAPSKKAAAPALGIANQEIGSGAPANSRIRSPTTKRTDGPATAIKYQ